MQAQALPHLGLAFVKAGRIAVAPAFEYLRRDREGRKVVALGQLAQVGDHAAQGGEVAPVAMQHRLVDAGMGDAADMAGLPGPRPGLGHGSQGACRAPDEPLGQCPMRQATNPRIVPAEAGCVRVALAGVIER